MAGAFRFAHENFIYGPSAALSASSFMGTLPPSYVLDQLLSKVWRSEGPWVVVAGFNDRIDLNEGGGDLVATLTPGTYTTTTAYALEVKTQLDVAGALTYTVTYVSERYVVAGTGTFSLKWLTGANAVRTAGIDLGFDVTADDTGTNSYTSDFYVRQGQHYLLLTIPNGRVPDLCVVVGHNVGDEGGFERREIILQGSIAGFPTVSHSQELDSNGAGLLLAELEAAPSTPWSACQEFRLVFRDISGSDGYSQAGVWFVGELVETSVRPSTEYSRSRQELSASVNAIDGAVHGDLRPVRHIHALKFTDMVEAGRDILEGVADATPPPTCFFMNFNSDDLDDTVYGYWADGGLEINMVASVYWNVSGVFLEAFGVTEIGRGALGLLDDLFDFDAFAGFTNSEKRAYLTLHGGAVPVGWIQADGHTDFQVDLVDEFDGIPLCPVGVITSEETLSEKEARATEEATDGTWFYNRASRRLHVNPTSGLDPSTEITVVVLYAFVFGTRGSVEPMLGPEKNVDPGFELWNSSTVPTDYTTNGVGAPGVDIQRESTIKRAGAYSLKIGIGNIVSVNEYILAGTGGGVTAANMEGVVERHYVTWVHYRTDFGVTEGLEARLRVTADGTNYLNSDGRSTTTSTDGFAIANTNGEWKQAIFAFRCPADTSNLRVSVWLFNNTASNIDDHGEAVYYDEFHIRQVREYRFFEPRMTLEGLPELQRAANDIYFGSETAGLGSMGLLNRDDSRPLTSDPYLETMLGTYDFCSRSAFLTYGGTHPNGQEISFPATEPGWAGVLRAFMVEALGGTLELESSRGVLSIQLPITHYGTEEFSDLAEADLDRPKAIVLGTVTNVRPARIDLTADGLGIYEALDATYRVNPTTSLAAPAAVYAYADQESADRKDSARRLPLAAGTDYDLTTDFYSVLGRFRMLTNPGIFEIVAGVNDCLDVTTDLGTFAVFLPPGLYNSRTLVSQVETVMEAVTGAADFTVTYDTTDHKVDIVKAAGTLDLLVQTGANDNRSAWPLLGYTYDADQTGFLSYTSETALPFNPDEQFIRMDMTGFLDDAAGSFTGTPNALIELGPDVAQFLLRKVLLVPSTDIDRFSFVAGRTTSPQVLGVYLGGLASVQGGSGGGNTLQEILDRIEVSCYADITVDAQGRWFWVPRIDEVSGYAASVAVVLSNADFLEFASGRSLEDVYHIVRVNFAQDPSTSIVQGREFTNPQTPVRFDRRHQITFDSYLLDPTDVEALVVKLARPASRPINRYEIAVKGKLMRMKLGELLDVSARLRKLAEPADQSEPYIIRLQELTWNPLTHICRAVGYTQYFGLPPA